MEETIHLFCPLAARLQLKKGLKSEHGTKLVAYWERTGRGRTSTMTCERLAEILWDFGYDVLNIAKTRGMCTVNFRKGNVRDSRIHFYYEEGAEVRLRKLVGDGESVNFAEFCCGADRDMCIIEFYPSEKSVVVHLSLKGDRWLDKLKTALAELGK